MKKLFSLLLIILSAQSAMLYATDGNIEYIKTYDINSGSADAGYALTTQNNKIVLAVGTTESGEDFFQTALLRYNSNGTLDSTFGSGSGKNVNNEINANMPTSVTIAPDNSIIIAGAMQNGSGNNDFFIQRNHPDGDTSITPVKNITDFKGKDDVARDVAIDHSGKIVAVGNMTDTLNIINIAIIRYTPQNDGSLTLDYDTTFDGNGQIVWGTENNTQASAVAIDNDNKIVVAGTVDTTVTDDMSGLPVDVKGIILLRFNNNGSLDNTFHSDGILEIADQKYNDFDTRDVIIQKDGKIVVGGSVTHGTQQDLFLIRLNHDGSVDYTFGNNGLTLADVHYNGEDSADSFYKFAMTCSGKFVVVGQTYCYGATCPSGGLSILARFNANGTLDTTFATDGFIIESIGESSGLNDVAILNSGDIVSSGTTRTGTNYDTILMKNQNGACFNPAQLMYILD